MPRPALTSVAGPASSRPPGRISPHARSPPPAQVRDGRHVGRSPRELQRPSLEGGARVSPQDHEQPNGGIMRRIGIVAVLATLLMAFWASAALAVPPTTVTQTGGLHVCQGTVLDVTANKTDGAFLTATGEVCGAGTSATATLSATVEATVGCITPSGSNEPRGQREVSTTTTGEVTFETRAGRGTFSVSTDPVTIEDFDFECPSPNMTETLVGPVTFTDITLTITSQTGTITATFPDIDP